MKTQNFDKPWRERFTVPRMNHIKPPSPEENEQACWDIKKSIMQSTDITPAQKYSLLYWRAKCDVASKAKDMKALCFATYMLSQVVGTLPINQISDQEYQRMIREERRPRGLGVLRVVKKLDQY